MSEWDKEFNDKLREKINSFSEAPPPGLWDRVLAEIPEEPLPYKTKRNRLSLILAIGLVVSSGLLLRQDAFHFLMDSEEQNKPQITSREIIKEQSADDLLETPKISGVAEIEESKGIRNARAIKGSTKKNPGASTTISRNYLSTSKLIDPLRKSQNSRNTTDLSTSAKDEPGAFAYGVDHETVPVDDTTQYHSGHGDQPRRIEPSLATTINEEYLVDSLAALSSSAFLIDSSYLNEKGNVTTVWDLSVVGGPNISYRSMSSQVHADVVSHRNAHEKSSVNYNVGMEVGMKYKRLRVSLGFGYFERGEQYFFQGQNIRHEFKNKYSYFSAPVNISYELLIRNRFSLSPMAGYAFNMLHQGQASWLNPHNHSEVHMNSNHDNPYRQSGHMLSGSLQVGYQFNRRVKLLYRVGYTHFLQSIYKPSVALDQRQYSVDHQFGIQVPLGRP